MLAVECSTASRGCVEEVFDLSQDCHLRLCREPFLRDCGFLDGAQVPGVDMRTRVHAKNTLALMVEYGTLDRPAAAGVGPFTANAAARAASGCRRTCADSQ